MNKFFLFVSICTLFLFQDVFAAEYNGQNIDGIEYDCSAYSYSTGNYYYVTVVFDGDEAMITFSHGGYIILTLDDAEIGSPNSISAYDYKRGAFWELDVEGLD
jgi:hypothetical protein